MRIRLWARRVAAVVLLAAFVAAVALVVTICRMYKGFHDLSYAEHLELDLTFVDRFDTAVLEELFEEPLSWDDMTEYEKQLVERQQHARYDLYLLSRVAPRSGLQDRHRRVSELVIEIIEPEELRGRRYTVVPEETSIQLPGDVCYSLTKVQSSGSPRTSLDKSVPIRYQVVHIYTE